MRFSLTIGIAGILLWSACSKDLSCYRDMIIGTWVEQAFDGQTLEANDRSVHIFDALNQHTIKRTATDKDNLRSIETVLHQYLINCKIISTSGVITERGEAVLIFQGLEVLRFTDSLLHVKVVEELRNGNEVPPTVNEITFKKVHPKDTTAKALQNLWTLTHSSDPLTPPFQIKFLADGSYQLLLADNPDEAEEGTYEVFGSFLMIEFEQSSIFGNSNKQDVACWDILFAREKEKETTMTWRAMVERGGERFMHSLDFTLVVQK